jgi:hypothetical protein
MWFGTCCLSLHGELSVVEEVRDVEKGEVGPWLGMNQWESVGPRMTVLSEGRRRGMNGL